MMEPSGAKLLGKQIMAVSPQNSELAYRAALKALETGLEAEGLRLLDAARRHHPREARLWQVGGLLHRSLEDMEPAIAAFREAARLAPRDPLIAHSLARVHLEAGLPAAELFRNALQLAPQNGDVVLGLAAALAAEEGAAAAIELLDGQLARNPGWLPGHGAICRVRWEAGERAAFTASFDRALAAFPRDIPLWRGLLITLVQGNLYEEALEAVARGRRTAGSDLVFDANEAVCYAELGRAAEADLMFPRLHHLNDATVRVRHVRHLLRTGRPAEAAALAETMLGGPAAVMFWPYVSIAWRMTGDPRWEWLEGDPRLVGIYDLGSSAPPLDRLARRLRLLHTAKSQPLEQSVRGGTQTEGALFSRIEPEIRALRKAVVKAAERHIAQLPPFDARHPTLSVPRGGRIRFAGAWSVRLLAQGHHSNHIHPAGWFSSALYVSLPGEEERGSPPAGWLSLGQPQAELGLDLAPTRLIEPKPGRLVLFPSTMWHGTVPFEGGERLTVAFDIAPPR